MPSEKTSAERQHAIAALYGIIRDVEVGMLTTVRPDGSLHTRPMVTRIQDPLGDLWFFSTEHASKTSEIREDHEVAIAYAEPRKNIYAAVSGRASIVQDRPLMARLWAPPLLMWFPRGPDDPDLALLRIRIRSAEYWDAPSSTMVEIIAAVQAGLDSPPEMDRGRHEKVTLRKNE